METTNCHSIKRSLVSFLDSQTQVHAFNELCVITLPLRTIDSRFVDIYVEPKMGNFVLVHDGGKTTSELYAQGIHHGPSKKEMLKSLALSFGATFEGGAFSVACPSERLQDAVLAVAQCATVAMFDLLKHAPVVEEEPAMIRVGRAIDIWRPEGVDVRKKLHIKGDKGQHVFDYVAFGGHERKQNVAVNVLAPTYSPELQSHDYGFLVRDIENTDFYKWQRLAVISKREKWGAEHLKLIRSFAHRTLEVESGDQGTIERLVPAYMEELARVA